MARSVLSALFVVVMSLVVPEGRADPNGSEKRLVNVDLQSKANQNLTDSLHGFTGNNFAELPRGDQKFGGISFKIEEGYLRLSGTVETGRQPKKPKKILGIPVGTSFASLHILHGTGYGAYGAAGDPLFVADGTLIGEYRLHFEDGTVVSIPVIYGEDVRDWWTWDKHAEVTRGKIAWIGQNAFSRQEKQSIHLYLTSWTNPYPDKKVSTLDYVCPGTSAASPFCFAISLEEK